ncbi:hypothetical protein [Roseateles sp. LYH14W]|uniref:Uncharacterized protein n=1 Tax=Pelomonas parva TaxID=3299032 RepID=A0ABW7F2C2_9BURK
MERIKHHFCWIKAVAVDAAGFGTASARSVALPDGVAAAPFTATGTFKVLSTEELPAISSQDLPGVGTQPMTATGTFRALVGDSLQQLSAKDLDGMVVPMTATAVFRALSDAAWPPLETFELELATATLPVRALTGQMVSPVTLQSSDDAEPDTATTQIKILLGESLPPLVFGGATFMGGWQFEADPASSDGKRVALRFMPIVGSRADALAWRATDPGKAWAKDALAISLLSFAAIGEI